MNFTSLLYLVRVLPDKIFALINQTFLLDNQQTDYLKLLDSKEDIKIFPYFGFIYLWEPAKFCLAIASV